MSVPDVLTYVLSVLLGITAALLIRRIYMRGSGTVRLGLTGGVFVVLGVALLIVIFGR
jgi:hypothetical protein